MFSTATKRAVLLHHHMTDLTCAAAIPLKQATIDENTSADPLFDGHHDQIVIGVVFPPIHEHTNRCGLTVVQDCNGQVITGLEQLG